MCSRFLAPLLCFKTVDFVLKVEKKTQFNFPISPFLLVFNVGSGMMMIVDFWSQVLAPLNSDLHFSILISDSTLNTSKKSELEI